MNKTLLSLMLVSSIYGNAQILQQENFDALNTATAIGQSSPVFANLGGVSADYSIVTSGTGKALQISVPSSSTSRYMWKDGLASAWTARTTGNNVFQVEYDYFTGGTTTSQNGGGIEVINAAEKVFVGLSVNQASKEVRGYYTNTAQTDVFTNVGTGTTPAVVTLPANTWVRLGFAYNSVNSTITFKGPGFSKVITGILTSPAEIDYSAYDWLGTNATSSTHLYDNMVARAVATESLLLATDEAVLKENGVTLFPTPAVDFINVKSKTKILSVYIYDMTGSRRDAKYSEGKVDVRELQSGVYMLGLKTENGLLTKKFIKK